MKKYPLPFSLFLGILIVSDVYGRIRDDDDCDEPCLTDVKPTRPSLQQNVPFKTNIYSRSPADTSAVKCSANRYRSINGSCNNILHPDWGIVNSKFTRLLSANYADGIHKPANSVVAGNPLPLARSISTTIYPDMNVSDARWTLMTMTWGQSIAHDMSLAIAVTQITGENPVCCGNGNAPLSKACLPILIPKDDHFYRQFNQACLNFIRTATDLDTKQNSGNKSAEQIVGPTAWMDASHIYGSASRIVNSLREFSGGRLKIDLRNNRQYPPEVPNKARTCFITKQNESCYMLGDSRGVQNPQIAALQILFVREHNRIASELSKINPQWNDEILFQETRRIVIAEYQHISYYEWLPITMGKSTLLKNKLIYETRDFVNDYDENQDPSIINEHATAAFRFFHSAIQGVLQLVKEMRFVEGSKRLSDWYMKPSIVEEDDNLDKFVRGLATQGQHRLDEFHTEEQTNLLFKFGAPFGSDLKAIDIQRSRDHGLGTYNDFRALCGFPRAKKFSDFNDLIPEKHIANLASLYESPDDVDFTVGGSLENKLPDALVGPTFSCVMLEQFYRTRVADAYFFESGQHKHSFTLEQLNEIRKSNLARILCDNSDNVLLMQPKAFEKLSLRNTVVPCNNFFSIHAVNLKKWKV